MATLSQKQIIAGIYRTQKAVANADAKRRKIYEEGGNLLVAEKLKEKAKEYHNKFLDLVSQVTEEGWNENPEFGMNMCEDSFEEFKMAYIK